MPFYGYSVVDTTPKPVGRKPSLPLPTAKSGSSGQYQPRGFPERISANDVAGHDPLIEGIGAAARAPGYIYERPFAAINTAARAITGTKPGEKSFIDQASDTIMGTPVLGDVLRAGGNVIEGSGRLVPSLLNSIPANVLKDTAHLPDSAPLDPFQKMFMWDETVGDLRRRMYKRKFTREDIDALAAGTKGTFDFADKDIADNPLIDFAGRLVADPLNALVVAGPARVLGAAGKIGRVGDLERATARVIKLADARAAVKSIPALQVPAKDAYEGLSILRKFTAESAFGARAIQAGFVEGITQRSAALFLMGMGRGGSALLSSYRKAALTTTGLQLGVNTLDAVIGDNSAVPGPLNDIFLLGRAMRDDTPLSDGMLFSLWAVTHFPARDMIGTVIKGANGRIRYHNPKSADVEARFVNEFGEGKTYAARRADFMARMGGEESWLDYHADLQAKHAAEGFAKSFTDQPNPRTMVETEMYHDLMNRQARARAAHDPIGGIEAMETARDWAMGGRFSSGLIAEAVAGLKMAFRPELMFSQWSAFRAIASRISAIPGFGSGSAVVPNLRQFLIREQLQAAHAELNMIAKANKGMIPAADAARFVNDHPALVINPETQQFWARALTPDAEALPVGSYTQRLRAAERDAVSMKEAVAPAESWEAYAQKEAANRAGAIRKDGSVDISKLDTEGQVVVVAPSATGVGKRNAGFFADTLDDVREMRNDPRLERLAGDETHRVMEVAGYDINKGRQVIAGEDGALAPAILYAAGTHVGQAEEALAALMKRAGTKSAGRIIVPGHLAEAAGKDLNALQHEWVIGGMDDIQARRVTDLFNNLFDGPIFDDTAGIMRVVTPRETVAATAGKLAIAARQLGDIFPERALGGVFDPQTTRVYTEAIRDTSRGNRRGRAARAAGTERSVADIAAGAQRSVNWHTANNEFAALGPLPDRRGTAGVAGQPGPNAGPLGQSAVPGGGDTAPAGARSGLTGELKYLRDPLDQLVPKYDASLNERFTPEELAKFGPLQQEITRYDPTYSMSSGPKGATPFYLGQGKAYADMAIGKQMTGDLLKYKVLSRVANFNHVLFGRVYTKRLASDGKQEFMSDLVNAGETPRMVSSFLAALKTEAETSRLVGEHAQLYMRGDLLPTGVINLIARGEKPGLFPGFKAETFEKLGGPTGVSEALRRSASRFYRKLEQNHRAVDGAGSLGKLIDLTYGPATGRINGLTGRTTHAIKGLYPVLRFKLDPRWHLMNKYEAPIIGAVRFGVRREMQHSKLDMKAFDTMGSSEGFQSMDAMASGWLDQRPLDDFMIPAFRVERTDSTIRVIESLGENHPLMIRVRERHGDGQTSRQYADAIDKDLYDFDTKGVRKTVEDEARQILDDDYYTAMQPLLQRITDLHRENFRTVVHSFHGNVNRSNVERMMNSWFLYWPISYQLKVAKVLFDTLTYRMGGRQTDLLGAWTIDRLQDEHTKRLATDREYQKMFESNPEVWQFAAQFLPVTPYDLGVSANRATRYISSAAGAALGFWDKDKAYPDLSGPKGWITMGERVANLGLPYSIDQAVRTLNAVLEKD